VVEWESMGKESDQKIKERAEQFARENKKEIANRITDKDTYPTDDAPVSVFMSGSPGAGKTEFSRHVLEQLEKGGQSAVRIDPDELRKEFNEYDGTNSYLFQYAVSILVDRIHDEVIKKDQNFILDGTLSNFEQAHQNITRSLRKDRKVEIFFIYQRPEIAWMFTKAREKQEGRMIPKEDFIKHFIGSQRTVNKLKNEFRKDIVLSLVVKDLENETLQYEENIDNVDFYLKKKYTESELNNLLDE